MILPPLSAWLAANRSRPSSLVYDTYSSSKVLHLNTFPFRVIQLRHPTRTLIFDKSGRFIAEMSIKNETSHSPLKLNQTAPELSKKVGQQVSFSTGSADHPKAGETCYLLRLLLKVLKIPRGWLEQQRRTGYICCFFSLITQNLMIPSMRNKS